MMVDSARQHRRVVQVGTQSRSRPSTRRAIEYARSGKIGKILMAKAWNVQRRQNIGYRSDSAPPASVDYDAWIGPAPALPFNANRFHYKWRWHLNYGTGDIGNDGVHQIDIARWALGVDCPKEITGMGRKLFFDDDQQTPDTMNVTFNYEDRVLLFEMRIWNPYGMEGQENGVALYGSSGMMHIGRWNRQWGYRVFDGKGKLAFEDFGDQDEHASNFLACVRSRQKPNADIETGCISTLHAHLGNIVNRTGRHLKFDAKARTIPGDAEAASCLGRSYRKHWATPKEA
jgi:predicted dehydrogenase